MLVALIMLLAVLTSNLVYGRDHWKLLLPFLSGYFLFLARIFYWDRFDWIQRVNNLLLLSIVFSFLLVYSKFRLGRRVLFYFKRLGFRKRLLSIFVISEILFIISSFVIVKKGVELVGDEAHYLVISQSIARDFDLNVFNQYARDEYREFINQHLPSHAKVGKGFKKWYSFHLPGLSLTLVPFFLFRLPVPLLYFLIRAYLGLFAALLAVVMYMLALKIWKRENLALLITMGFCFTSPIFFLSNHIFAEVQVLLLLLSSLYLLLFKEKKSSFSVLSAGFLLSITVFWGMKYVIFIAGLGLGFLVYFVVKREYKRAILFILFPILFLLVFFAYLNFAYGNFSPLSVYTGIMNENQAREYYQNVKNIGLKSRLETLLDYFFDQRDGLLPYNPFYFFFFPGMIIALKKFKTYAPFLMVSAISLIYLLYHGFSTVRAGVCPQGRYLVPMLWTVMLFSIIYYLESKNQFFKRLFWRIPLVSFLIVVYQVLNPFTLYQTTTHDYVYRSGLLFQKLSNIYINVSNLLPSFIKTVSSSVPPYTKPSENLSYLPNTVAILVVLILIGIALIPIKTGKIRVLLPVGFVICFVLFTLFPRVPLYNPQLVAKTNTVSHLVHGASFSPGKIREKKFRINEEGRFRFLISTREQVGCFILRSENPGRDFIDAEFFNFDHPLTHLKGFVPGTGIDEIIRPLSFQRKKRYYYQFTVKIHRGFPVTQPVIIEFLPLKDCTRAEQKIGMNLHDRRDLIQ